MFLYQQFSRNSRGTVSMASLNPFQLKSDNCQLQLKIGDLQSERANLLERLDSLEFQKKLLLVFVPAVTAGLLGYGLIYTFLLKRRNRKLNSYVISYAKEIQDNLDLIREVSGKQSIIQKYAMDCQQKQPSLFTYYNNLPPGKGAGSKAGAPAPHADLSKIMQVAKVNEKEFIVKFEGVGMYLNGHVKQSQLSPNVLMVELNRSNITAPMLNCDLQKILDQIRLEVQDYATKQPPSAQITQDFMLQFIKNRMHAHIDNQNRLISLILTSSNKDNIYIFENVTAQAETKAQITLPDPKEPKKPLLLNLSMIAAVH